MARLAGKLRGDLRALEEQSNDVRTNPVRGRGATPSMGLSQFRGGRRRAPVIDSDSESDEEVRGGGFLSDLGIPVVSDLAGMVGLGGGAHHRTRNSASRMSNATAMGLQLGKHLHALHGAGFWDDFKSGFNSVVAPIAKVAKPFLPLLGPEGAAASAALGAVGYGRRGGAMYPSGQYEGQGTGGAKTARQLDTAARKLAQAKARRENQEIVSGAQALAGLRVPKRKPRVLYTSTAFPDMIADAEDVGYRPRGAGRERDDVAMTGIVGRGMLGQDGHGMRQVGGRKKRSPAGPNDGRRARAEIVRRVMNDRKIGMIEASKYVKAHNLY